MLAITQIVKVTRECIDYHFLGNLPVPFHLYPFWLLGDLKCITNSKFLGIATLGAQTHLTVAVCICPVIAP